MLKHLLPLVALATSVGAISASSSAAASDLESSSSSIATPMGAPLAQGRHHASSRVAASVVDTTPMRITRPLAAQRALADALGAAESVDFVRANDASDPRRVAFGIERAGEAFEIIVRIDKRGDVIAIEIDDVGRAENHQLGRHGFETGKTGGLSWLVGVMKESHAVARLIVGGDGTVVMVTDRGERYLTVRRWDANAPVEARWGASWNV